MSAFGQQRLAASGRFREATEALTERQQRAEQRSFNPEPVAPIDS